MIPGRRQVLDILDRHGIELRQSLGQNFVIDPNTVRRIADLAAIGAGDHVLEIGAGIGTLTAALVETGARITAVEIDDRLVPALRETVEGHGVEIVVGDATELDLAAFGAGVLVANLPYNVGTTIFLRALAGAPTIERGVVMVQREVAARLTATPGGREWGIPSVKAAWFASLRQIGTVPPSVFVPRPKVDSALVSFERRPEPDVDRATVFALVDTAFGQRRKMLRRSLAGTVDDAGFAAAGIDPARRPESLSVAEWTALGRAIAGGPTS